MAKTSKIKSQYLSITSDSWGSFFILKIILKEKRAVKALHILICIFLQFLSADLITLQAMLFYLHKVF